MEDNNFPKTLLIFKNHWDFSDEFYWETICQQLNEFLPPAIYSMSSEDFGWDSRKVFRIVTGNGEALVQVSFEAIFELIDYDGFWGLNIFHHDSAMGDYFEIHKYKSEEAAKEFLRIQGCKI